jgi:hypothetical protein
VSGGEEVRRIWRERSGGRKGVDGEVNLWVARCGRMIE